MTNMPKALTEGAQGRQEQTGSANRDKGSKKDQKEMLEIKTQWQKDKMPLTG